MANYFLTVQGMDGGSNNVRHVGAFGVSDFTFDISNIASAIGSGAGTGKTTVAPLLIDLQPGSFLNGLLKASATGIHIVSAELQGALTQGPVFYDLRLQDVTVTKVVDTSGTDKLQLSFSKFSIAERTQKSDGSLTPANIFSFDLKNNTTGNTQVAPTTAGQIGGAGQVNDYFLHVDGLQGTTNVAKFLGDFDAASFSFNVFNAGAISTGSGAGTGKATFSPLTVYLDNGSPLNGLIKMSAQGRHTPLVELKGVDTESRVVYDLKLTDALVSRVTNGPNYEKVQFNFSKIQLTTREEKTDGTLEAAQVFSFNLATNSTALAAPARQVQAYHEQPVVELLATDTHHSSVLDTGSGSSTLQALDFGFHYESLLA